MVNIATVLVLFLMLTLSASGCDAQVKKVKKMQGETKMEEPNEESRSVLLETNISLQDKILTVEYRIRNKSAKAIYLFNVLWEFGADGKYVPAPQPLYALLQDNGSLHLAKAIPALPKSKRVELKIVPFATKVDAGKEFSEKFEIAEPLHEYNPYFLREKDESEELKTAESVFFTIQFVEELENMEVKPAPLDNSFTVWHQDLSGKIKTLSSKPRALLVKVNKRTDSFERF
jgi:hypothetical protein